MSDQQDKMIAAARKMATEKGIPLSEAMETVEARLIPRAGPTEFAVTIRLKPRVARWVSDNFGGHPKFTVEERLGAWLVTLINQQRAGHIASGRAADPQAVGSGSAVTVHRSQFKEGS